MMVYTAGPAATGVTVWRPVICCEPVHAPLALHESALDEDHMTADVCPKLIFVGLTEISTVGGGTSSTPLAEPESVSDRTFFPLLALLATEMAAVNAPLMTGANRTVTEDVAPGANGGSVPPPAVMTKLELLRPVGAPIVTSSDEVPLFDMTKDWKSVTGGADRFTRLKLSDPRLISSIRVEDGGF